VSVHTLTHTHVYVHFAHVGFAQENSYSISLILYGFSHRSLDLTGPLFLGGVPNLPENFPFGTREFIGCMKDLHIDNRPVDMAGFIANNGTVPGVWALCDDSDVLYPCNDINIHYRSKVWYCTKLLSSTTVIYIENNKNVS